MDKRPLPITDIASGLQGLAVPEERAAELAIEVERLNGAVRAAARNVTFADEPAHYVVVLEQGAK
jgi:hypothetical protein